MSRCACPIAALIALAAVAACTLGRAGRGEWSTPPSAAETPNPLAADAASIARGGEVYRSECASCHGEKGKGDGKDGYVLDPPPADLTGERVAAQKDGTLFFKISEGHEGMPPFAPRLTPEARWHVVNYVRSLAPRRSGTAEPQAGPHGPSMDATDDPQRGGRK